MRDEKEKSHADEGEGNMRRRYPRAISSPVLEGGARKRQETNCRIESLDPKRYTILILARREKKTYQSEKEKDEKKACGKKNAKKHGKCGCIF